MATYKNTNGDYIINVNSGTGNLSINASFSATGDNVSLTASDSITLTARQTTLNGNLTVIGDLTYVDVQDLKVDDPFITVAGNNTGNISTAVFQNQGLVAQTSSETFAGIRFNNDNLTWQVSSNVFVSGAAIDPYTDIAISSGSYLLAAPNNSGTFNDPTWPAQGIIAQTSVNTYAALRFNNDTSEWEISANVTADGTAIAPYSALAKTSDIVPASPEYSIQFNLADGFSGSNNFTFDDSVSQLTLRGYQAFVRLADAPDPVDDSVVVYHKSQGQGGTGLYVHSDVVEDELVSKSRAIVFGLIL